MKGVVHCAFGRWKMSHISTRFSRYRAQIFGATQSDLLFDDWLLIETALSLTVNLKPEYHHGVRTTYFTLAILYFGSYFGI